jgi:foldase protein PrsA
MSPRIRAVAAFGTVALCISLVACSNGGSTGDVASVNGQKISRADFDHKLESGPQSRQTLTQMVQQALIDQYARDNKITIPQSAVDAEENDIKAKYPSGQFEQLLKQQGLTESDVQAILRQRLILEKAVAPNIKVSDADVRAYFNKNHALFDKPAQVRARHILVADLPTAKIVLAKLKAGGSWDALAKQYSTDPSSKDKGGELGFFSKGQMVAPFQDAAFAANVGQIIGPVKSPFGYHIIQVEEKKPPTRATFASVQKQIRTQLVQQQEQTQIPAFLQTLRQTARIDVYDDRYKDAFPPPLPTTAPAVTTASPAAKPASTK